MTPKRPSARDRYSRRSVSQETLAEIADIHRTHLGALELGQREPRPSMLPILADALEIWTPALEQASSKAPAV